MNFYLLQGKIPIREPDLMTWAAGMGKLDARVAFDKIHDASISTVFLGLDHQHGAGLPLLFETMIFDGELDGQVWRYSTWADAELGHANAVALVRRLQIRSVPNSAA